MKHSFAVFLFLFAGLVLAQGDGIQKGKVKKIDADKLTITLSHGDKDHDYTLTEKTQVLDGEGKDLKERLKEYKEGAEVFFKIEKADGKEVVVGLKLAGPGGKPGGGEKLPKVDTSK